MSSNDKPSFLTLPTGERIAYHSHLPVDSNSNVGVIFCCGFRSSMDGNKALELEKFCLNQLQIGFTRFDYRGHGQSHGGNDNEYFETIGLSDWIADARAILQEVQGGTPRNILVGSSMGAWIALQLALERPQAVAGILGIAAAPDFTHDIWKELASEQRNDLLHENRVLLPSEYSDDPYPISRHLLEDSNQWLLLENHKQPTTGTDEKFQSSGDSHVAEETKPSSIGIHCPVRLVHGQNDVDVSWKKSSQLVDAIAADDVHMTLIKSGDHRLSTPKDLDIIVRVLEELVDTVNQPR